MLYYILGTYAGIAVVCIILGAYGIEKDFHPRYYWNLSLVGILGFLSYGIFLRDTPYAVKNPALVHERFELHCLFFIVILLYILLITLSLPKFIERVLEEKKKRTILQERRSRIDYWSWRALHWKRCDLRDKYRV